MTANTRSRLSTRLAAAAARITTTRATAAQQAAPHAPQATTTAPAPPKQTPNPKAARPAEKPASSPANTRADAAKAKRARGGGSDEERGESGIAQRLRQMARNPEALSMVPDHQLAEIWDAMVRNATNPGSTGATDRQALFRAAGLPFQGGLGSMKGEKQTGAQVRDRLERAVQRARRQPAVTRPADDGQEVSDFAA